jgi:hypothetical protein
MHKADFDLLSGALRREHRDAKTFGNRTDVQRVEHTVLTIAEALAGQNRSFLPVTWILESCGVRSVSQLTAGSRREIQERFGTTRREIPIRPGDRSKQAKALAHAIAARVGVNRWDVGAQYVNESTGYRIMWANGPTWHGMRDLTDELMATGRYQALAGTHLDLQRNTGPRAWAARVVAAYREETLWEPVKREAARIRAVDSELGLSSSIPGRDEEHALDDYVQRLVDETEHPERASDPADEPVIERLLKAGQNSEFKMAVLVLARDPVVFLGEMPAGVTPLRARTDGGAQ